MLGKRLLDDTGLKVTAVKDCDVRVYVSPSFYQFANLAHHRQRLGFFTGGFEHDHILPIWIAGMKLLVDLSCIVLNEVLAGT